MCYMLLSLALSEVRPTLYSYHDYINTPITSLSGVHASSVEDIKLPLSCAAYSPPQVGHAAAACFQ